MKINIPAGVKAIETFGQITVTDGQEHLTPDDHDFRYSKGEGRCREGLARFPHPAGTVTYDVCVFDFNQPTPINDVVASVKKAGWCVGDYVHLVHWLQSNNKNAFGKETVVALYSYVRYDARIAGCGGIFYPTTQMREDGTRGIYSLELLTGVVEQRVLAVRIVQK